MACNATLTKLSDAFGQVVQSTRATITTVQVQANPTRTLKNLTSYEVTLSLNRADKQCQWTGTGTGRNKEEAVVSAIKKMDTGSCLQTLDICQ